MSRAVDPPGLVRSDDAKAAAWSAIAGVALIVAALMSPTTQPAWQHLFRVVGSGLILPLIAMLHVRHATRRESGTILGTISGTAVVAIGIAAAASTGIDAGTLLVRGIWWWTIGKMWWETALLPRGLGVTTMLLAAAAFIACLVPPLANVAIAGRAVEAVTGLWLLGVSFAVFRSR